VFNEAEEAARAQNTPYFFSKSWAAANGVDTDGRNEIERLRGEGQFTGMGLFGLAEREGFEPPIALRLCLISSQALRLSYSMFTVVYARRKCRC
jgi:hypothetical protein